MSFGSASNGPDFGTDLSRCSLDRFGKFDLALSQRLIEKALLFRN
jgi:hypothetical protein